MRSSLPAVALLLSCSGIEVLGGEESGNLAGGPRAVIVGPVDSDALCNMVGVKEVVMRATQVECEEPAPAECIVADDTIAGDRMTCPSTEASALLGVEVPAGGRYAVEAVPITTTQEELEGECYALPGASPPILVTTQDVDAGAHIMADATGSPCP
jgi:hypothetical protein